MKAKQLKAKQNSAFLLIIFLLFLQSSCLFSDANNRYSGKKLSLGILNGLIHKGMTPAEVVEEFGMPAEKKSPTVFNNVKTQIFVYTLRDKDNPEIYYLYFKDDKLIGWEIF